MRYQFTRYFEEVMAKRSYLKREWIDQILDEPAKVEKQEDGRVRYWGFIRELGKYVRLIVIVEGSDMYVHNMFPDRDFEVSE